MPNNSCNPTYEKATSSNSSLSLVSYSELCEAYQHKICKIYNESFPDVERVDFDSVLVKSTRMDKGVSLYGMLDAKKPDDENLAGLACVLIHQDMMPDIAYILYLAIDPALRGCGYGSAALNTVASMYPNQGVALDIETVSKLDGTEDPVDRDNRIRRLHFYEKNGFKFTGHTFDSEDISYDLMFRGDIQANFGAMRNYFSWLEDQIDGFFF